MNTFAPMTSVSSEKGKQKFKTIRHEEHISKLTDKDEAEKALSEYNKLREIAKCHKGKGYPVIKKWFLQRYPEVKDFLEKAAA